MDAIPGRAVTINNIWIGYNSEKLHSKDLCNGVSKIQSDYADAMTQQEKLACAYIKIWDGDEQQAVNNNNLSILNILENKRKKSKFSNPYRNYNFILCSAASIERDCSIDEVVR